MEYKAITNRDPSTELTHWKYIKREKKNGKWRYYYDKEQLKDDVKEITGYKAKEDMQKYQKALDQNSDRLDWVKSRQERNAAKIPEAESKHQQLDSERKVSAQKTTEAGFDLGLAKTAYDQEADAKRKRDGGQLKISSDKKVEDKNYYDSLNTLVDANNKAKTLQETHDRLVKQTNSAKTVVDARKTLDSQLQDEIVTTKRKALALKKNYIMSKSIYDKSLAGFIDRGKKLVDDWLDSIRKKL